LYLEIGKEPIESRLEDSKAKRRVVDEVCPLIILGHLFIDFTFLKD